MAEIDYNAMDDNAGEFNLPSVGKLINAVGAIVSVGLIAGLCWWGYQLVVRDVSGVPVVRALEGPMRVAPEDPGGELASHQGLAVNNIPAQGEAQQPADRLVLAPQPTNLAEDDTPVVANITSATESPETSQIVSGETLQTDVENAVTGLDPAAPAVPAQQDPAGGLETAITAALTEATSDPSSAPKPLVIVPSDLGGVTKSIVPLGRPDNMTIVASNSQSDGGVSTMAPADIPAGTRLAQLGAFDSRDIAVAQWRDLSAQFPEFMANKARVIEEAQSGGKLFFRLRAHGFEGLADARRFCAAFVAANQNCIPVKQR